MESENQRSTVGLQYSFHESMPGRFTDQGRVETFWKHVEMYRTLFWPSIQILPSWPASISGGVSARPNLVLHHSGEMSLVESVGSLVEQGCDAIAICDMQDPGVELARSSFDIPVIGALEASLVVARTIGHRIGWVTAREHVSDAHLQRNLARLGLVGRPTHVALAAWDFELLLEAAEGNSNRFLDDFDRCATELVEQGADVVIPTCVFLGPVLGLRGYHEVGTSGVPVVDPYGAVLTAAAGLAEMHRATGLRSSKGLASIYRSA